MNRFYVYTREEPRQIASFLELVKDPTLAVDAAKENRACPGFLFHGDTPESYASARNLNLAGPGLKLKAGQAGSAVIRLHCPYLVVAGTLTLKAAEGADLSLVEAAVSRDGNFLA